MLFLNSLEGGQDPFSRFGGETACSQPHYESALLGNVIRALADMPPNHLKLGLIRARR